MGGLLEIAHFYEPEEAFCAKGYLRSLGIQTVLQNEHHLNMNPAMRVALGGYRLLTNADQADDARNALREISEKHHEPIPSKKNWLWLPVAMWSGVPFVPRRRGEFTLWKQAALALFVAIILCYWAWVFSIYYGLI